MNQTCPKCGIEFSDDLPGGMCPSCLMNQFQNPANPANSADSASPGSGPIDRTLAMPTSDGGAPDPQMMNQLFEELEVLQLIGQGGMGAVYKARQKNLDRIVALKVFLYKPDDPEFAERFAREARALAKLNHPNIVTVHDFGKRENFHFLIMEFVEGLNLREVSQREKLSPADALKLVPQLCDALQFAHDHGVVHRDIKPENVLLDKTGRIKIADFGLAKMTGSGKDFSLTGTQQVMGTFNYMAPEQMERPTEVDHRADIYSLGVVIYELLTSELPKGLFQPPSKKVQIDVRLDEIVMRAMAREPELRFQNVSDIKTSVESVASSAGYQPPGKIASAIGGPPPQIVNAVMDHPATMDSTGIPAQKAIADDGASPYSEISSPKRKSILMMLYRMMAMLVLFTCPLFFMAASMTDIFSRGMGNFLGIATAMLGGYLFACTGFVHRIFGIPPESDDPQELKKFKETTVVASMIRMLAMLCGFGCGLLFIARNLLDLNGPIVFIAIGVSILCGFLFAAAGMVDEVLVRSKSQK